MYQWDIPTVRACARTQLRQSFWFYYLAALGTMASSILSLLLDENLLQKLLPFTYVQITWLVYGMKLIIGVFIWGPLRIGVARLYIEVPRGRKDFNIVFSAFTDGRYKNSVLTSFLRNIIFDFLNLIMLLTPMYLSVDMDFRTRGMLTTILSLLLMALYVCGMVLSYCWFFAAHIIADYPTLGPIRALKTSAAMTKGYKSKLLALSFSFFGWIILCVFIIVVAMLLLPSVIANIVMILSFAGLNTYTAATVAQLYYAHKGEIPQPDQKL